MLTNAAFFYFINNTIQKYSKNTEILLQFKRTVFYFKIPVKFSATISPFCSVTWSFWNHSNIRTWCL